MINSKILNFRFYKILESQDLLEHGKYQAFDTPYDAPEFNWGQAFYIITDKAYITHKIEEDDLARRIDHIAVDGPIQVIYCPPTKEDIESIYTMTEDIRIAGVYSSCTLEEGPYKNQKCGYCFFTENKTTHCFTPEELIERVCSGKEEKAFKQKVYEAPEIKINDKGRVIRWKVSHQADGIRNALDLA